MKNTRLAIVILANCFVVGVHQSQADVINVDFNVTGGSAGTYSGSAISPDMGIIWNGLAIGSQLTTPAPFSSPSLFNSIGSATSVQVQLSNYRPYEGGATTPAQALLRDLAAGVSGDAPATPSPLNFTISGLTAGAFYDLYLYSQNANSANSQTKFTIGTSQTVINTATTSFSAGVNYVKYANVQAVGGSISGTAQTAINGNAASFNGFQIQSVFAAPVLSLVYSNSFEAAQGYTVSLTGAAAGPGLNNNGGQVQVLDAASGYNAQATDGTQFLGFNGANMPAGAFYVTPLSLPTSLGVTYYLKFDYGTWGASLPQTISVTVSDAVTGVVVGNTSVTDPSGASLANTALSTYTFSFTGNGHPVYLKFQDTTTGTPNTSDGLFDNLRLFVDLNTIPEPNSVMLLAFGGILLRARRRVRHGSETCGGSSSSNANGWQRRA